MNRISNDTPAVVIVGSGAGGGTLAYELTKAGIPCVVLEAGPHYTLDDWVNDEWEAFGQMAWLDPRTTSGSWGITKHFPSLPAWLVKAVGGTTTHWAGACPRFMDYELKTLSTYGRIEGATLLDWPITLEELAPYYDAAEKAMGVTHVHGRPPLPANNNYKVLANGAERVGYRSYGTGPYATNAEPYDGRPASIQDGFNFQGDKHGSKWSTLVREIPRAIETGLCDLRPECQAVKITHDRSGRADAVLYVDKDGALHRQAAKVVCVAGNSIESPRLLLLSDSSMFPNGIGNSSDQVGRNYMRHLTGSVYAWFEKPVHMYRGETMAGVVADEVRHDPGRGFVGGFYMETLSLGVPFLAKFIQPDAWGRDFTGMMDHYDHIAGLWIVGEDMPQATNRVTLSATQDRWGIPVANVHYDDHPNDVAMRTYAYGKAQDLYKSVGAIGTHRTPPYPATHNLGTCRMSARPEDGVVNKWGQTHDVANVFVSDGSVMTTGAAANPTLTIVALAIRQAEYLAGELKSGRL
jgi:choline dehydrogenase-like flavoprotein